MNRKMLFVLGTALLAAPAAAAAETFRSYVCTDGSQFVAVGGSSIGTSALYTSPDGTTWTSRTSSFGTTFINAVHGNGSLWVAGGDSGKLATSPDGVTWTQQTSSFGSTAIYGVTWDGDEWVAVGGAGKVATSPDGVTWTQQTSSFGSALRGVAAR